MINSLTFGRPIVRLFYPLVRTHMNDGYCSTVQGSLDWFEVDLGFTELLFIQIDLRVLCVLPTGQDTHVWAMARIWMIHGTDEWVMARVWVRRGAHRRVMAHRWMSHGTHGNNSARIMIMLYSKVKEKKKVKILCVSLQLLNESRHTHECISEYPRRF